MNNLYLFLDLAALLGPLALSFDRRVRYFLNWKFVFAATALVAIPFIIWDVYFTVNKIWGFNSDYLIGVDFFDLPIEEILFFIIVPFSCTFIYECCKYYLKQNYRLDKITLVLLIIVVVFILYKNHSGLYSLYSALSFIIITVPILLSKRVTRVYQTFFLSMIPFFIMNGILTGSVTEEPIVWYNDIYNSSVRLGTIPIEDTLYGTTLIFSTIFVYESIKKRWLK